MQADIPEVTPRTAFSRSVVFHGKPEANQVDSLISNSMSMHAVTGAPPADNALQGESATLTTSHPSLPARSTTQPIYVTSSLNAPSSPHHLDGRRGGDTAAIESVSAASASQEWPRTTGNVTASHQQKLVIAVICGLLLLILLTAVALYFLAFA